MTKADLKRFLRRGPHLRVLRVRRRIHCVRCSAMTSDESLRHISVYLQKFKRQESRICQRVTYQGSRRWSQTRSRPRFVYKSGPRGLRDLAPAGGNHQPLRTPIGQRGRESWPRPHNAIPTPLLPWGQRKEDGKATINDSTPG